MLWIQYEGSKVTSLDVVKEIVFCVAKLIHPIPVAAEDQEEPGYGIYAYDCYQDNGKVEEFRLLKGLESQVVQEERAPPGEPFETMALTFHTRRSDVTETFV